MIQRSNDDDKKSSGRWEFPGGLLERGEAPWEAAQREWEEETGNVLPDKGRVVSTWENDKGPYRLFVYVVKHESDINLNPDRDDMEVRDPDHPNAKQTEVMAW
ncbi:MAG: NUDIX hydrolase, partial [Euryarchaeota archaeon]|nr:NUDIX hydrolase [Euryarchaeota archaeon]